MVDSLRNSSLKCFSQAYDRLESVVGRLAKGDLDSLPEDMVDLSSAKLEVAVAAKLFHTADATSRYLLDLLA